MIPASTHKGQAVLGFPDVCKTPAPAPGAPVPIPYTNTGSPTGARTRKSTSKKGMYRPVSRPAYKRSSGDEAGALRSQLSMLHSKLMTMPPGDTTTWHKVLDEYVMTSANVYKALSSN